MKSVSWFPDLLAHCQFCERELPIVMMIGGYVDTHTHAYTHMHMDESGQYGLTGLGVGQTLEGGPSS